VPSLPDDLPRHVRLDRAASLIENTAISVS